MRVWLVLVWFILLSAAGVLKTDETYTFKLPPQGHIILFEGAPAFSYGVEWEIQVPAPSQRPESVNIRELSTYVYKYIAFNAGAASLTGGFSGTSLKTEFVLEGVYLGVVSRGLPDRWFDLEPGDYYWGPGRPRVTLKTRGRVSVAGQWPDPDGAETWTLKVRAISHFDIFTTGPLLFGQLMRQRVKGQVTYKF